MTPEQNAERGIATIKTILQTLDGQDFPSAFAALTVVVVTLLAHVTDDDRRDALWETFVERVEGDLPEAVAEYGADA